MITNKVSLLSNSRYGILRNILSKNSISIYHWYILKYLVLVVSLVDLAVTNWSYSEEMLKVWVAMQLSLLVSQYSLTIDTMYKMKNKFWHIYIDIIRALWLFLLPNILKKNKSQICSFRNKHCCGANISEHLKKIKNLISFNWLKSNS